MFEAMAACHTFDILNTYCCNMHRTSVQLVVLLVLIYSLPLYNCTCNCNPDSWKFLHGLNTALFNFSLQQFPAPFYSGLLFAMAKYAVTHAFGMRSIHISQHFFHYYIFHLIYSILLEASFFIHIIQRFFNSLYTHFKLNEYKTKQKKKRQIKKNL